MRCLSCPLVVVSLFATCVTFASLSSLQRQCDEVPVDRQLLIVDDASGDTLDVTSAVYGSASLQGVQGFSAEVLLCSSIYRHQWFVIYFQVLACLLGLLACARDMWYRQARFGVMGLFVILSVLYIQMSESFLTVSSVAFYREVPQAQRTLHAMLSGCIATAALDVLLVLALGVRWRGLGRRPRPDAYDVLYGKALPL